MRTERLLLVAELMARGEWVTGETAKRLAAEWGLAVSTVENYSAEASRLVKLLERPTARLRLGRALDAGISVAERALADESGATCKHCGERCGHESLAAVAAVATVADRFAALTGANEPARSDTRTTVNVLVTSPEWLAVRGRLLAALEAHPEARVAVVAALTEGP